MYTYKIEYWVANTVNPQSIEVTLNEKLYVSNIRGNINRKRFENLVTSQTGLSSVDEKPRTGQFSIYAVTCYKQKDGNSGSSQKEYKAQLALEKEQRKRENEVYARKYDDMMSEYEERKQIKEEKERAEQREKEIKARKEKAHKYKNEGRPLTALIVGIEPAINIGIVTIILFTFLSDNTALKAFTILALIVFGIFWTKDYFKLKKVFLSWALGSLLIVLAAIGLFAYFNRSQNDLSSINDKSIETYNTNNGLEQTKNTNDIQPALTDTTEIEVAIPAEDTTVDNSNSKSVLPEETGMANKERVFFYDKADTNLITKAYIVLHQEVKILAVDGEFFEVEFTNEKGKVRRGYMLQRDINY